MVLEFRKWSRGKTQALRGTSHSPAAEGRVGLEGSQRGVLISSKLETRAPLPGSGTILLFQTSKSIVLFPPWPGRKTLWLTSKFSI